jgi:hypothetical protein
MDWTTKNTKEKRDQLKRRIAELTSTNKNDRD